MFEQTPAPGPTAYTPAPAPAPAPAVPVVNPVASGTAGVDLVVDQAGDTDLYCGTNQDLVTFASGSGFDLLFGFDPSDAGDLIAIEANVNGTGLASADQLAITDTEYGAYVDLGSDNGFLIADVAMAELDASDFAILPATDAGGYYA